MSAPIGSGDWVECVDGSAGGGDKIVRGEVYRVDGFSGSPRCRYCRSPEHVGLVLSTDFNRNDGWCSLRFRPIYRPSESLFLKRLMDVPADPQFEDA